MTREPSSRRAAPIPFLCLCLLLLLAPLPARATSVNVLVKPSNGGTWKAVVVDAAGNKTTYTSFFNASGTATFFFYPEKGYVFDSFLSFTTKIDPSQVPLGYMARSFTVNFREARYKVTTVATGGTVSGCTDTVPSGGSCTLTVQPDSFLYTVGRPSITPQENAQGVVSAARDSYTVRNVVGDVTVNIPFVPARNIRVTAPDATILGPDGTPLASGSSVVVPDGDSPTFTVTPRAGYACVGVSTPSGPGTCDPSNKYTLPAVTRDGELKVTVSGGYTILGRAGANGTISPGGAVSVIAGQSQQFSFTPAPGYAVQGVTVDNVGKGATPTYTFSNVQQDHAIEVTFKPAGASMENYCNAPPFVASGIKPNLLLLIDNSASMYDLAYSGKNYCVDDSYDDTRSYAGYFEEGVVYAYDEGKERFVAGATLPRGSSCNAAATSYLCVHMGGNKSPRTVVRFLASGRFLNWLSASKLDVEKKVLTGGKFVFDSGSSTRGVLQGESRGCQGKRFVKMLPATSDITFAVRGPLPMDGSYTYRSSLGGDTRIEIYDKGYPKEKCQAVVDDWLVQKLSNTASSAADIAVLQKLKGEILACLNNPSNNSGLASRSYVYSLIMSDCFYYLNTGRSGMPLDPDLEAGCKTRFNTAYAGQISRLATNEFDDSICAYGLNHATHMSSSGFLGMCMSGGVPDSACVDRQKKDFCEEINTPTVTDPAATSTSTDGQTANLQSFVLDAGTSALGSAAGTFLARADLPYPPTGQIQAFSDELNIGAMVFNNGAGSECGKGGNENIPCIAHCSNNPARECYQSTDCDPNGTISCIPDPRTDGGRIVSYINYSPLGDHTPGAGLIPAIDSIGAKDGIGMSVWTPFAEAFYEAIGYFANRQDLRLQETDFDASLPPSKYSCQKNNVLIISDGMSTADASAAVHRLAATYSAQSGGVTGYDSANRCPAFQGSRDLDDLTWIAANRDITTFKTAEVSQDPPTTAAKAITTHAIYLGPEGNLNTADSTRPPGECNPATLLKRASEVNGGGHFASAPDPSQMEMAFKKMMQLIATGSSAGSDATLLSTGDGNGALFLQPLFYTKRTFDNQKSVSWAGELQSLWYYLDPMLGGSDGSANTIREDTGYRGPGEHVLDLKTDRVVEFFFDADTNRSRARVSVDNNGDGVTDAPQPEGFPKEEDPEEVQSIWRAGEELWKKDSAARKVYTHTGAGGSLPELKSITSSLSLLQAQSTDEAAAIVDFVLGGQGASATVRQRSGVISRVDGTERVWKLGDIISSTPRVQSQSPLNSYHLPSPGGYFDASYSRFIGTDAYRQRGTVYVGANDGMLHAFRLGSLRLGPAAADLTGSTPQNAEQRWGASQKGALSGAGLGEEAWGFVPKNALPYLKYLKDPVYTHLYYVDGAVALSDVSIGKPSACTSAEYWDCNKDLTRGSNWRTVLIGGMGLGGATRDPEDACSDLADGRCVKSPLAKEGRSSYFALDVTEQTSGGSAPPALLWEFAPDGLGYATSGAAVVKVSARDAQGFAEVKKNGRWFAVFGSGPTGPINCSTCQFMATSDQNLKIFVVDLGANSVRQEDKGRTWWEIDTGIPQAYAGSIAGGVIDVDKASPGQDGYYQDDAVYIGYTRKGDNDQWDQGGVLRLVTMEDLTPGAPPGEDPRPGEWRVRKVIDGIGPVTGGIAKLQDRRRKKLWLYFGTGRYHYNQDDMSGVRRLYGIQDPCYSTDPLAPNRLNTACTDTVSLYQITDKTGDGSDRLDPARDKGWYVTLEGADQPDRGFGSERVLSAPTASTAGAVFFSTFKPSTDRCFMGGKSYLWGVKYDTGGALGGTPAAFNGKALTLLSTGTLASFSLKAFPEGEGRRSSAMTGKPGGVRIVSNSGLKPVRKILHMQER